MLTWLASGCFCGDLRVLLKSTKCRPKDRRRTSRSRSMKLIRSTSSCDCHCLQRNPPTSKAPAKTPPPNQPQLPTRSSHSKNVAHGAIVADLAFKRRSHFSTIKHFAQDRSRELPTHSGKSMPNKVDYCFAKHGKLLKLRIRKATRNFRKRFANRRVEPVVVMRLTCRPICVAKFCDSPRDTIEFSSEEFLEKLKAQKVEAANSRASNPNPVLASFEPAFSGGDGITSSRRNGARLQFAEPALTVVSRESLNFLPICARKIQAPRIARYSALLASAANNPQSDANTVSLLSSYIFTPHLFVTFSGNGTSTSQMSSNDHAGGCRSRNCATHSFKRPPQFCFGHCRNQDRIRARRVSTESIWS